MYAELGFGYVQKQLNQIVVSVALYSFMQKHLSGADHAPPPRISVNPLIVAQRCEVLAICEPGSFLIMGKDLIDQFLEIVGVEWVFLA